MQVDVHAVDAEVTRAHAAHDGVEVGAVAIEVTARLVDHPGDLDDVGLEQAAGVGVGQHDAGDVGPETFTQRGDVDPAARVGGDILDPVAAHRRRRRVGPVGALRHQHHFACFPSGVQRGADAHEAADFAMRARRGRHGDRRHAGQGGEPMGEDVDQLERPLRRLHRLQGVYLGEAGQARDLLVQARIVLHGAGTERIHAHVDAVVVAADADVMAYHFGFRQARQAGGALAGQTAQPIARRFVDFRQIDARGLGRALLENQRLLMVEAPMARVGPGAPVGGDQLGLAALVA